MILRSSYTQSVFTVYPIYTEDIIERYLIKSVNISDGRTRRVGKAGRTGKAGTGGIGWDRRNGRVLIKILPIEEKLLPLLKVKNILYRKNEYRATTSIK